MKTSLPLSDINFTIITKTLTFYNDPDEMILMTEDGKMTNTVADTNIALTKTVYITCNAPLVWPILKNIK